MATQRSGSGSLLETQLGETEVLTRQIWVPAALEQVFSFFSDAQNLEKLTPTWLKFSIQSPLPIEMKVGALIDYRIKLFGLPMRWRTLISAWEPPVRFVDQQLRGPYSVWIHEHGFAEINGGTLISDVVRYLAPFSFLAHPLMVRRQLQKIFDYRSDAIRAHFSPPGTNRSSVAT